jgi:serine/threonine-protein kinase SRK2
VQIDDFIARGIIRHSNVFHPSWKEVFLTSKHLAVASEYIPGGNLFQHVKRNKGLPESQVPLPPLGLTTFQS